MLGERVLEQLLVSVPNAELPPSFRTKGGGGGGGGTGAGAGAAGGKKPAASAASAPQTTVKSPAEVMASRDV